MVDQKRLQEIVNDVMTLRTEFGQEDNIFDFLRPPAQNLYAALNSKLGELLHEITKYETLELAMYLRSSYNISDRLQHWRPLLIRAVEQGKMRGDNVGDIFYGLIPKDVTQFTFR